MKYFNMKKTLLLTSLFLFFSCLANSQDSNYKVVFDMTSKDTVNQQSLIRQLSGIKESNANAQLEVVIYSQALPLVTKGSAQQQAVSKLITESNVSFKVCAATLKRYNIDKSQLVPGVEVVPDGIYEIVMKQKEGWGYIKVGH